MFDQPYPYRLINHTRPKKEGEYEVASINYTFKSKNNKGYIVVVESFDFDIYAIKFYLREHKYCQHKYRRLTHLKDCSRVLATIGKIMLELHTKNPYSSFAFTGSNSMNEEKSNTKRFKLYKLLAQTFFGPTYFEQYVSSKCSSCILLNRNNSEFDLFTKVSKMFSTLYEDIYTDDVVPVS